MAMMRTYEMILPMLLSQFPGREHPAGEEQERCQDRIPMMTVRASTEGNTPKTDAKTARTPG